MSKHFLLKYFSYKHLPEHLQAISMPFADLAAAIVDRGGSEDQMTEALRKLLEAKDCAVRACL